MLRVREGRVYAPGSLNARTQASGLTVWSATSSWQRAGVVPAWAMYERFIPTHVLFDQLSNTTTFLIDHAATSTIGIAAIAARRRASIRSWRHTITMSTTITNG